MQAEQQADPTVDTGLLGKYRLILELGQGGTAVVYLGALSGPSGFNKLAVLKVMKSELASEKEFRQMFLDEARLAARLNHPNVVQTNEVFEVGGCPVIVMEYLEGQPLSRILTRAGEDIPLNLHLKIISDVLSGLHYAHELTDYNGTPFGLVHRDMTPQNVFVGFDGRVCILDFGIAKLQGADNQTRAGVLKGKIRYMAPEQIRGEQLDRRADIFAVGIMLWEVAARVKIWKGLADTAILCNVINNEIPSPRTVRPDISEELERICMKALSFDREQRYATAADLQVDLDALVANDPVPGRAIGRFTASLFETTRTATGELIEKALSSSKWSAPASALDGMRVTSGGLTPGAFAKDNGPQVTSTDTAPRHRSPWLAVPLLLLAGAGTGYMLRAKPGGDASGPHPATTSLAPAPPAAPDPPAPSATKPEKSAAHQVLLNVDVSPDSAQVYLDGTRLDSNPYAGYVVANSGPHTIRAEAQGFETESREVTFDSDIEMKLLLGRSTTKTRTSSSHAAPQPTEPRPAPPPAAAVHNCDPPFTMDASGIRRFKPECL